MHDLPRLADRLFNQPLLAKPSYAETVATVLAHRMRVQPILTQQELEITKRPARDPMLLEGGILVLPVVGGLYHRGDGLDAMSGAQSYTNLQNQLTWAMDAKEVRGILLDLDSPGGEATGCFEFADVIRTASEKKPIWAIANGSACSGAYAIGSAASRFAMTPSGVVGSIGVCMLHVDVSKQMDALGVVMTHVYAGKHKVDGTPYKPLPDTVKAGMQSFVDTLYSKFVSHVAAMRSMSEASVRKTEAQVYLSEEALDLELVDDVMSFEAFRTAFSNHLNPVIRVHSNGATSMTQSASAPAMTGAKIEGLSEALAQARKDGETAALATIESKVVAAYQQGRADAMGILGLPEAKGREGAAMAFAGNPRFSVEDCKAFLTAIPQVESEDAGFAEKLKAQDPKVAANGASPGAPKSDAQAFQSDVARNVRALLGIKAQ